jgi:Photosynthesis system II assembly factor YCF48/Putative zinc-finger
MSDVAKFVRHAMNGMSPGEHPDENLLSAFSEGTLSQREKDQLLPHLSECGQCREIIALSMPEKSQPLPASPLVQRQGLRWPVLRWAGALAALVIVATAVLLQKSRIVAPPSAPSAAGIAAPQNEYRTTPPAAEPSPPLTDRVTANARQKEEVRMPSAKTEADKRLLARKDETSPSEHKKLNELAYDLKKEPSASKTLPAPTSSASKGQEFGAGQGTQSRDETQQSQVRAQSADAIQPAQTQAKPQNYALAQEQVSVAGGMSGAQSQASGTDALKMDQQAAASPSKTAVAAGNAASGGPVTGKQKQQTSADKRLMSANESVTVQSESTRDSVQAKVLAPRPVPMVQTSMTTSLRWRISSRGKVERSTDAGRSWHDVTVTANAPAFRSISVVGSDIWAGGTGGALYHSSNAGATWAPVTIKSEDMVLADDVVRVEFTDAQDGSVTAKSGAVWATRDAGATWTIRH